MYGVCMEWRMCEWRVNGVCIEWRMCERCTASLGTAPPLRDLLCHGYGMIMFAVIMHPWWCPLGLGTTLCTWNERWHCPASNAHTTWLPTKHSQRMANTRGTERGNINRWLGPVRKCYTSLHWTHCNARHQTPVPALRGHEKVCFEKETRQAFPCRLTVSDEAYM